ncbi:GNAT family N-acetyltransferase [Streptomyces sp. NBC_00523]|uniref:GNAT family N-acetyltransferase n=1 Tax=Streptomyces sp. NBC_00523 TaxID=2975765 RepID=UPI002E809DF4|nr:GNAT family N-acetyltransferase [Streptomyces sp. NBC_00523]WUD03446.1 GNAT family N-acetyltransferase [Streptomyces sp. NBC_00523]
MNDDPLMARARRLWETLAGVPAPAAPDGAPVVVTASASALCPPAWVGTVLLGDAALVTAPTDAAADEVRRALKAVPTRELAEPEAIRRELSVAEVLGPATLAYLAAGDFRPYEPPDVTVTTLPAGDPELLRLLGSVSEEDAGECGLDEITSPAFVVREDATGLIAAAGYEAWPGETAHLCVLTAPGARGRGLARAVASAATHHALAADRLPQWRARPEASRRVARALGYRELGRQLSVRLHGPA